MTWHIFENRKSEHSKDSTAILASRKIKSCGYLVRNFLFDKLYEQGSSVTASAA